MNNPSAEAKPDLLKRLRKAFSGLGRCRLLKLREAYRLEGESVRVPYEGFPMELILGRDKGKRLRLYPEQPLQQHIDAAQDKADSASPPSFLLEDPDHAAFGRFLRLEPGKKITLGRRDPEQLALFNYPDDVDLRHLRLTHDGDAVIFEDKSSTGTCISPALNDDKTERLTCLQRIQEIYGGPIEALPTDEAMKLIAQVIELMKQEAHRPRDSRGLPGGLVELPQGPTPVVVADLHAQIDNLLVILSHHGLLDALDKGEAYLVIIGDAVHSEREGELDQMDDSIVMMDLLFRLKLRFPEHFFFIRGNHDSFHEEISKGGIPQGLFWRRALKKARGKEYRKAMQDYYDLLPYIVSSPDFGAAHAAPPRSKVSKDMLIEIERYPGLIPELLANRMNRPNRPGGYTKGDVKRFRKTLGLAPETPFIVGHTPMDNVDTYWLNVGMAENHHILYSAHETWVGAFVRIGEKMQAIRYPVESLRKLVNQFAADADQAVEQRQSGTS